MGGIIVSATSSYVIAPQSPLRNGLTLAFFEDLLASLQAATSSPQNIGSMSLQLIFEQQILPMLPPADFHSHSSPTGGINSLVQCMQMHEAHELSHLITKTQTTSSRKKYKQSYVQVANTFVSYDTSASFADFIQCLQQFERQNKDHPSDFVYWIDLFSLPVSLLIPNIFQAKPPTPTRHPLPYYAIIQELLPTLSYHAIVVTSFEGIHGIVVQELSSLLHFYTSICTSSSEGASSTSGALTSPVSQQQKTQLILSSRAMRFLLEDLQSISSFEIDFDAFMSLGNLKESSDSTKETSGDNVSSVIFSKYSVQEKEFIVQRMLQLFQAFRKKEAAAAQAANSSATSTSSSVATSPTTHHKSATSPASTYRLQRRNSNRVNHLNQPLHSFFQGDASHNSRRPRQNLSFSFGSALLSHFTGPSSSNWRPSRQRKSDPLSGSNGKKVLTTQVQLEEIETGLQMHLFHLLIQTITNYRQSKLDTNNVRDMLDYFNLLLALQIRLEDFAQCQLVIEAIFQYLSSVSPAALDWQELDNASQTFSMIYSLSLRLDEEDCKYWSQIFLCESLALPWMVKMYGADHIHTKCVGDHLDKMRRKLIIQQQYSS